MKPRDVVVINRPRYPREGVSAFQGKHARIKAVKGRALTLVLLGETEKYTFWTSEVDLLDE